MKIKGFSIGSECNRSLGEEKFTPNEFMTLLEVNKFTRKKL